MAAIETVIPSNLREISVERILNIKQQHAEELREFRSCIAAQQTELARLAAIQDSDIRYEAFAAHMNSEIKLPLERLERALRLSRIDTVRALLAWQTLTPSAVVLGLGELTRLPPVVAAAGTVATVVGSAWWQLAEDRQRQIRESPVGYLLNLKRTLTARTFATQVRRVLNVVH